MPKRSQPASHVRKARQLLQPRIRTREEKQAKASYEQYRRRRKCLGKKSDELNRYCGAKVFLLVVDEGSQQSHFYSSETLSGSWPPSGLEQSPVEAAELLNPANVKKADELTTSKSRRDWLQKEKENRLDKYRITHIDVKFHQKINGVTKRPEVKGQGDSYNNWELASQYKALYRKDQIKAEWRVYEAAKLQAKRFLEWFQQRHPDGFAEYRRSQSRDPTVQPFKRSSQSASPGAASSADPTPSPEEKVTERAKPTTRPGLTATQDSAASPDPPSQVTQKTSSAESGSEAGRDTSPSEAALGKDELKEVVLEGYCAAHDIRDANKMTAKEKMRFDIYFEVYAKNKGY